MGSEGVPVLVPKQTDWYLAWYLCRYVDTSIDGLVPLQIGWYLVWYFHRCNGISTHGLVSRVELISGLVSPQMGRYIELGLYLA